jgi:serine protease Do
MRHRWSLLALFAATLGIAGCRPQPPPILTPEPPTTSAPAAPSLPPIATTTLPPAPVPATFDVAALAEQVKPMVVNITTTQKVTMHGTGREDPFDFFFGGPRGRGRSMKRQAVGTGVIIDPGGYIITNEHVIREADDVRVHLADERELKVDVVGRDPRLDIALLKIKGVSGFSAAPLGVSEKLRVGEHVLAVGNPFGLGHTVTLGIVSAKARTIGAGPYDDFIQTDASINPGNSGGPLFNSRGEVVGINTAIRKGANGIGFAIPIDEVKDVLGQLRDKGHVERGRLGLGFQAISPDIADAMGLGSTKGALVSQVEPGSAAARAGIHAGDVIVSVNGTAIGHAEELPRRVARNPPGATVDLTIVRGKQRRDVKATLDPLDDGPTLASGVPGVPSRRAAPTSGRLGMMVTDMPGGGVRVDEIDGDNVRDLMVGDVILEVNGARVRDSAGLNVAMSRLKPGTTALLKIRRGKLVQFAAIPVSP